MAEGESVSETEIGQVREKIRQVAEELIGRPLVSVVSVDRDRKTDDDEEPGWVAAVEMLERKSVPDTQDILGRYEISLDADHEITGYRRTHRYRRDDMDQDV
ncbi:MAG: gas vesicle protein [Halalkalicoccus sp.]